MVSHRAGWGGMQRSAVAAPVVDDDVVTTETCEHVPKGGRPVRRPVDEDDRPVCGGTVVRNEQARVLVLRTVTTAGRHRLLVHRQTIA